MGPPLRPGLWGTEPASPQPHISSPRHGAPYPEPPQLRKKLTTQALIHVPLTPLRPRFGVWEAPSSPGDLRAGQKLREALGGRSVPFCLPFMVGCVPRPAGRCGRRCGAGSHAAGVRGAAARAAPGGCPLPRFPCPRADITALPRPPAVTQGPGKGGRPPVRPSVPSAGKGPLR